MFFKENAALLQEFSRISKTAGARADYVQGGGNTSVKLAGGLMAIKASDFCLSDIEPGKAYAVPDGTQVRNFYLTSEPEQLENVETAGSVKAKEAVNILDGLAHLRASVEACFHSILKTFVVHTHTFYANPATCAVSCRGICQAAFAGTDYPRGMVPSIIMQNHGIIAHDDNSDTCLALHADANERLEGQFGITGDCFPKAEIKEVEDGLFEAAGHPLSTISKAAKHFIANWESKKYHKSLAGKKGDQ